MLRWASSITLVLSLGNCRVGQSFSSSCPQPQAELPSSALASSHMAAMSKVGGNSLAFKPSGQALFHLDCQGQLHCVAQARGGGGGGLSRVLPLVRGRDSSLALFLALLALGPALLPATGSNGSPTHTTIRQMRDRARFPMFMLSELAHPYPCQRSGKRESGPCTSPGQLELTLFTLLKQTASRQSAICTSNVAPGTILTFTFYH